METLQPDISTQSLECQQETPELPGPGNNIRVYVRVRPPTDREQAVGTQAVFVDQETNSLTVRGDQPRHFTFDGLLGEDATQDEVFELVGRSIGESCLAGYNGSIYVYGQTGVGKTYTMCGPVTSLQSMQFEGRRGLICRILDFVFAEIYRRRARSDSTSYHCRCSFLEIYKEQIVDLLDPSSTNLQVREDVNRGIYVERLTEQTVTSLTEAFQVLWKGLQERHVSTTQMNERSSRSHAVFTLSIETSQTRAGVTSTRVARLSLVDLAGSERQVSAYHSASARVKEAGAINKSLSALTNVIMSLSRSSMSRRRNSIGSQDGDGRRPFAHYRDSKLTFLLRDSLGGNSKTVVVANVSPSSLNYIETLSTLKFAARAKHIRCAAVRNEEFSGTVESLMSEVKALRRQLAQLSSRGLADADGGEPAALEDEGQVLYSRKRARRLEVLLAGALERERHADHRRHQLQRLAEFLEDLSFRKEQYLGKLLENYSLLAAEIGSARVLPDTSDGDADLKKKLVSFRSLLSNLTSSHNHRAPRDDEAAETPPVLSGPDASESASQANLATAIGGSMNTLATASRRQGSLPSPNQAVAGAGSGNGNSATPLDADGRPTNSTMARMEEATFLIEENKRLRRQLERHMELHRLNAEHQDLRRRLAALDPASRSDRRGGRSHRGHGSPLSRSRAYSDLSPSDDSSNGDPEGSPMQGTGKEQSVTAEMLLRLSEVDDDSTALRTWIYFQKMAKEVEELLRTKESLSSIIVRSGGRDGKGGAGAAGQPTTGIPGSGQKAGDLPSGRANTAGAKVEWQVIEDLAQCSQDALSLAASIVDSGGHTLAEAGGGGSLSAPSNNSNNMGRMQSRLTSSSPHLHAPTTLQLGNRGGTGPVGATGFLARTKSTRGLGSLPEAPSSNAAEATTEQGQLQQALQRVRHLYGTLDIVNSAYSDVYDQFQRLREEYESRLEECQFFELQCSRLDMQCHELAERLHSPLRPGPAGNYSAVGLSSVVQPPSRRSLSLSSLRDAEFWEERFRELSRLTGVDDAASRAGGAAAAPPEGGGGDATLPQSTGTLSAGVLTRRFTPLGAARRAAMPGAWQPTTLLVAGPTVSGGSCGSSAQPGLGHGTPTMAHSASLSAFRSEEERTRTNSSARLPYEVTQVETVRRVASAPLLPSARGIAFSGNCAPGGSVDDSNGAASMRLRLSSDVPIAQSPSSSRPAAVHRPPGATTTDNRSFRSGNPWWPMVGAPMRQTASGGATGPSSLQTSAAPTSQPQPAPALQPSASGRSIGSASGVLTTSHTGSAAMPMQPSTVPASQQSSTRSLHNSASGRAIGGSAVAAGAGPAGIQASTAPAPSSQQSSARSLHNSASGCGNTATTGTSRPSSRGMPRPRVLWPGTSTSGRTGTHGIGHPQTRPGRS